MRYAQITVVITVLSLCLLSCRETIGEQHQPLPKEDSSTPLEREKIKVPSEKNEEEAPIEKPLKKELKTKKSKASDTLRPKIVAL